MPLPSPIACQEDSILRLAAEDQLKRALGQIEELRRENGEKDEVLRRDTEALRAEVDASNKELNAVLDDRYQLQVALKAAQRQLDAGGAESVGRIRELESGIRQAARDYQVGQRPRKGMEGSMSPRAALPLVGGEHWLEGPVGEGGGTDHVPICRVPGV